MAVSYSENGLVAVFPTNGDETTRHLNVLAFHSSGAVTVKDGGGKVVWDPSGADSISFCRPMLFEGIEKDAGEGTLYVYLS